MVRSHYVWILLGLLYFLSVACSDSGETVYTDEPITEVNIDLDSVTFQKVYDYRDRWETDSLLPYLKHRDPSFRALSARIISDIGDEDIIEALGELVFDTIPEVRRSTLYSLGQLRSPLSVPHLMRVFNQQDSMGVDPLAFKFALEGIGKCADSSYLRALATISTYTYRDTLLLQGQALGILNMAYRGYSHPEADALMVEFVKDSLYAGSIKLLAAQYLATVKNVDLSDYSEDIVEALQQVTDPDVRMYLVESLGKAGSTGYNWINRNFNREKDYRVKIQMLRGALHFARSRMHGLLARGLRDRDLRVAGEAGNLLLEHGHSAYSQTYLDWAFGSFPREIKYKVFAIANRYISNARFRGMNQQLIFQQYNRTEDPYLKADLIKACGFNSSTVSRLAGWFEDEENLAVRTSIIEAVIRIVEDSPGHFTESVRNFLIDQWSGGDVAAVTIVSDFIANHQQQFPGLTANEDVWEKVEQKIKMPGGIEAMIGLKKAKAEVFHGGYDDKFYMEKGNYTHPVDWSVYKKLSKRSRAEVVTSKGKFEIQLFTDHAPATVINFVELAESGYFNKKLFHRVVPNFVVQGGGNRGDGYGSLDYTIRSELGPKYYDDEGYVGMASAGKHTESQQWFVTHRPTLHLNGRYTLFGKVINNMDVVHQLERGDQIQEITIKY